jgi:hypothetical protein
MGDEAEYLDDAGEYYAAKHFYEREHNNGFSNTKPEKQKRKGANMEIVKVMFQNRNNKAEFSGREYSYNAGILLRVGDIVSVPTKGGAGKAKVTRVNIKDEEIGFDKGLLKTIVSLAIIEEPSAEPQNDNAEAEQVPAPTF